MNIKELENAQIIYNDNLIEECNSTNFTSVEDFKLMPRQKYMINLNPIFLAKGDEFKSLSINNMRYFYGDMHDITIDKDLKIEGDDKEGTYKTMNIVCDAILKEGELM